MWTSSQRPPLPAQSKMEGLVGNTADAFDVADNMPTATATAAEKRIDDSTAVALPTEARTLSLSDVRERALDAPHSEL